MSGAAFLLGGIIGFMAAVGTAVFTSAGWLAIFGIYCATSLAITVAWIATQLVSAQPQDTAKQSEEWLGENANARVNS